MKRLMFFIVMTLFSCSVFSMDYLVVVNQNREHSLVSSGTAGFPATLNVNEIKGYTGLPTSPGQVVEVRYTDTVTGGFCLFSLVYHENGPITISAMAYPVGYDRQPSPSTECQVVGNLMLGIKTD